MNGNSNYEKSFHSFAPDFIQLWKPKKEFYTNRMNCT